MPISPFDSALRRVQAIVRSSSLRNLDESGREGMKKKTMMARRSEGRPSTRKRMRQLSMLEWILETPAAISPEKAPASEPAEMKRPMRFASSCFVYQKER